MGDFLQPVGNGPHHDIAAQPWRVGAKESPPFQTQVDRDRSLMFDSGQFWLDRYGSQRTGR